METPSLLFQWGENMPLFKVLLDDGNASHSPYDFELVADDEVAAGKAAIREQVFESDCTEDHGKETDEDDCCTTCGSEVGDEYDVLSVRQIGLDRKTMVGIMAPSGLLDASDCNSQVDGSSFDGPCLWPDLESAKSVGDDFGGLAEDQRYVRVTLTVREIGESS